MIGEKNKDNTKFICSNNMKHKTRNSPFWDVTSPCDDKTTSLFNLNLKSKVRLYANLFPTKTILL